MLSNHPSRRILSLVLTLVMLVGMVPVFLSQEAEAVYHTDNAEAATEEVLNSTTKLFAATPGGAMLRVVEGKLYVWGLNSGYGMGLANYDENGDGIAEATTAATVVKEPTLHDYEFDGAIVKIMTSCNSGVTVLTDKGSLYSWGSIFWSYVFGNASAAHMASLGYTSSNGGRTPIKWDLSRVTGKLVDVYSSSLAVSVQDSNGKWYTAGSHAGGYSVVNMCDDCTTSNIGTLKPVAEWFIDRLQASYDDTLGEPTVANQKVGGSQRRTIVRVIPSYGGGSCFTLAKDPDGTLHLFSTGHNNHGQNYMPDVLDANNNVVTYGSSTRPVEITNPANYANLAQNLAFLNAQPDLNSLNTEGHNTTFIDASGSVWIEGDSHNWLPDNLRSWQPQMIYDSTMIGARAVRTYQSSQVVVILAEDNSLYALGRNSNQFISTDVALDANVTTPTQIFKDLSALQTITGVYVTELGVMVVTASGDTYYAGDTTKGTAGTGSLTPTEPGEVNEVTSTVLPPIQPLTANELIFEIELADGMRYRYDPSKEKTPGNPNSINAVQKIKPSGDIETVKWVEINAGQICKLNVYFNDFGKLTHWVLPIRFDPSFVNIVRGDGTPYDSDKLVTPGAVGESVGIVKTFTNDQWSGGNLIGDGVIQGGFPRICNGEGWVSVSGYTSDKTAKINGEVKMCSIYFTPVDDMGANVSSLFTIADSTNADYGSSIVGGYDPAGIGENNGAAWIVVSATNDKLFSKFAFSYRKASDTAPFIGPAFNTKITWVDSMALAVKSADGAVLNASETYRFIKSGEGASAVSENVTGPQISFNNKSATFSVVTNYAPTSASFPQVDWDYEIHLLPDGEEYTNDKDYSFDPQSGDTQLYTYKDFITILGWDTGTLRFQINSNYPAGIPCVIRFSAVTQRVQQTGQPKTATIDVVFRSFEPPHAVYIEQADLLTDDTMVYTDIYTVLPGESRTFTCDFPGETTGFTQTAVVWTLMDSKRNPLTGAASDYATLGTPSAANAPYLTQSGSGDTADAYEPPSVTLNLQHTTFGDEYMILRVESAYDGSVSYEIKIKIHQRVTGITWKRDKLYLLKDGGGADLSQMITIAPDGEYYEANLEWSYHPYNESGPFFIYMSPTSGKVQPINESGSTLYDQVSVRDTISGKGTTTNMKISVITVNSPIKADNITVNNLLGTKADYAKVYGLLPGDSVIFVKDYTMDTGATNQSVGELETKLSALGVTNYKRFNNLTSEQIGQQGVYNFPLPDFLNGQGGELGFILIRDVNGGTAYRVFDKVPVQYGSDPSKVYGYVQCFGKDPGSDMNKGISIKLVGPSNPEVVETTTNGYFVFQEYIIPGEYTMIISKDGYLTRTIQADASAGYRGIVIREADEFAISTYEKPIELFPGDIDGNGSINASDITSYVRNWYGQYDYINLYNFAKYDFYDLDSAVPVINLYDLVAVTTHNGWTKTSYDKWYVPSVS